MRRAEIAEEREPTDYEVIGMRHARYRGRDYYGEHAADMAELAQLRDWKLWALRRLQMLAILRRGGGP